MYHGYDIHSNIRGSISDRPQASGRRQDLKTTGLQEIVIGVANVEQSLHLYGFGLGLDLYQRGSLAPQITTALWGCQSSIEVAILRRNSGPEVPRIRLIGVNGRASRPTRSTSTPGPLGIGFTTQGIGSVHQRLKDLGVEFLSAPIELTPEPEGPTGPRRFEAFGQAPDGEFVVLIERQNVDTPYGSISERWQTSEPLHTSHVVSDLAAASRFMTDVFAHEVLFREECQGPEFEQLMGVPVDTRFRFEMLAHPDQSTGRIILIEYADDWQPGAWVEPPQRGLTALRYDCTELDTALERARQAGATLLRPPLAVDTPTLGTGRAAALRSPIGILIELWQPE